MRRPKWAVLTSGVALLLVAGVVTAGNMGFKFNRVLLGPGSSLSGTNLLALPFHLQNGMVTAQDLIDDIAAYGGSVASVGQFQSNCDCIRTYDGVSGYNFPLEKGRGIYLQMKADFEYLIVGTHDPDAVIALEGPGASSSSGTHVYSLPYHTTAADADDLIDELVSYGAAVVSVSKFVSSTDSFVTYTGASGVAFALEPTEAYKVQLASDVVFTPSHY